MFLLLFVGCKSDHPISSIAIPEQIRPVASSSPTSTTNIYYMIDKGPGCAFFISQSDADEFAAFFGTKPEGTKVIVVDGHFPPPTQMRIPVTISASQSVPPYDYGRRDMSLIDDTGTK